MAGGAAGGITRVLLCGLGIGSFVRETINFRHLWIGVAIAVALDWQRARANAASAASGADAADVGLARPAAGAGRVAGP